MTKQYYYTINCLPFLSCGQSPPIRKDAFLSLTKKELKATDFTLLQSVELSHIEDSTPLNVLKKWYAGEKALRNELVRRRAPKLGLHAEEFTRGNERDYTCSRFVEEVCHVESPLIAEAMIDQARWRFLEELERRHYFDIEKLVIYFLKLQLLEKKSLYDHKKGRGTLDATIRQVEKIWDHKAANDFKHEN